MDSSQALRRSGLDFSAAGVSLIVILGAVWALFAAAKAPDAAMQGQSWLILGGFIVGILMLVGTYSKGGPVNDESEYNEDVVKAATIATLFWGVAGLLVGVIIAGQLAFPFLNVEPAGWLSFGRLRPLHTSAVIFAFGGNALLATSLYAVQRTCRARLAGGIWPWFVFWGYQFFIVIAATGYLIGITQGKEYAEPEWYADLWLTIVWVAYLLVFLGTLWKRKEPHIYVANWFFLAFIVTVAVLHLVNNAAVPVSFFGSQSFIIWAGVQDALTQWWYGHNAVGFFLTAGFLGIMYYFIPKRVQRPVYSYRLSIIHFWSLIFIYIWAGPHHLHYTALPEWAQTLGMTFSIMLWMPSWGGMINGLMTLSGAWDKLRTDPVVRMFVLSLAFYGMSTFEGPMMSIRAVNALSHYTEWTVGHVHSGALGWVGMISYAAVYCLVPWLWKRKGMHSKNLIEWHFWLATGGILLYIAAMWPAGIFQGLDWRAYTPLGFLEYSFMEVVQRMNPYYVIRMLGGVLYLSGALVMVYNVYRTIRGDVSEADESVVEQSKLVHAE